MTKKSSEIKLTRIVIMCKAGQDKYRVEFIDNSEHEKYVKVYKNCVFVHIQKTDIVNDNTASVRAKQIIKKLLGK